MVLEVVGNYLRVADNAWVRKMRLNHLNYQLMIDSFLVFPASFSDIVNTQTNSGTISIVAVILLALGYSLSVALWFICSSWLFQFDVLFVYVFPHPFYCPEQQR